MQKFSFSVSDLTSFDKPAGEYMLERRGVKKRGRKLAANLTRSMPPEMLAGLCIVAIDAAGNLATVVPLTTVH